jgi:hypothetical protein
MKHVDVLHSFYLYHFVETILATYTIYNMHVQKQTSSNNHM